MPHSFSLRLLPALTLLVLAVSHAAAQNEVDLRPPQRFEEVQAAFERVLANPPAKLNDQQKKDMQVAVRGLLGPLTAHSLTGASMQAGAMKDLTNKCFDWLTKVYEYETSMNADAKDYFAEAMIQDMRLILMNSQQKPVVRVNTARVLARLAAVSRKEVTADLIAQVVADPGQLDGVRYWALQGLTDLTSPTPGLKPQPGVVLSDALKEKVVPALVQYIERKPPGVTRVTPTDVLDGLRMVRKEAIRALANLRVAHTGKPEGRAALTLARVMRKDKILELEPRLDEQVEAAIGLCQLPADQKNGYKPDYSAYQVGLFVDEFGKLHTQSAKSPRYPWKQYAARMIAALQAMDAAHGPTVPLVGSLFAPAQQLLQSIEINGTLVSKPLSDWLKANSAPAAMFDKDSNAVVQPAGMGS